MRIVVTAVDRGSPRRLRRRTASTRRPSRRSSRPASRCSTTAPADRARPPVAEPAAARTAAQPSHRLLPGEPAGIGLGRLAEQLAHARGRCSSSRVSRTKSATSSARQQAGHAVLDRLRHPAGAAERDARRAGAPGLDDHQPPALLERRAPATPSAGVEAAPAPRSSTNPVNRTRSATPALGRLGAQRLRPTSRGRPRPASRSGNCGAQRGQRLEGDLDPLVRHQPADDQQAWVRRARSTSCGGGGGRPVVHDGDVLARSTPSRPARRGSPRRPRRTRWRRLTRGASRDSIHQPSRARDAGKTTCHCSRCTWWTSTITGDPAGPRPGEERHAVLHLDDQVRAGRARPRRKASGRPRSRPPSRPPRRTTRTPLGRTSVAPTPG